MNNSAQENNTIQNNNTNIKKAPSTINIILFVLSLINTIIGLPLSIQFGLIWTLFGALGERDTYYKTLIICGVYIVFTIIFFLVSTWNVIKHSKVLKIFYIGSILSIAFIIFLFGCYVKNYSNNRYTDVELKNNYLVNRDDVEIKVIKLQYASNRVEINFSLNNKSDKSHTFFINDIRVNNQNNIEFSTAPISDFYNSGGHVLSSNGSDAYEIYIDYDELRKYNIQKKDIKKIAFKITIYSLDIHNPPIKEEPLEEYLEVEIK